MQPFTKNRLKHCYIFLYPIIYFIFFIVLEQRNVPVHIIEHPLDKMIPFCEYFIIPYFLWFLYVAVTVAVFYFFLDLGDFYRLCMYLFSGMTVFLIVSWLYPNGLFLRPDTLPENNFFAGLVRRLYHTDTSTNVLPSIHVYNSICVHTAIIKNTFLHKKKWLCTGSCILMVLIILSTMFLKQHSVIDVITGIAMAVVFYPLFYRLNLIPFRKKLPLSINESSNKKMDDTIL